MANFEIFAKGPPFALWPKFAILSTLEKNNAITQPILVVS